MLGTLRRLRLSEIRLGDGHQPATGSQHSFLGFRPHALRDGIKIHYELMVPVRHLMHGAAATFVSLAALQHGAWGML